MSSGQTEPQKEERNTQAAIEEIAHIAERDVQEAATLADSIYSIMLPKEQEAYYKAVSILSTFSHDCSRYDLAFLYANQCRTYFDSTGQKEKYLDHLLICAQTQVFNGKHSQAKELLNECFDLLKSKPSRNDYNDLIKTHSHEGIMYAMQDNAAAAIKSFSRADSICEIAGNKGQQAAIAGYMGNVYAILNRYEQSIEYHQKAKEMALGPEVDDLGLAFAACDNIAGNLMLLERFEDALKVLEEARTYKSSEIGITDLATNYSITADLLSRTGQFEESEKFLNDALALHQNASNKLGELQVMRTLAGLFQNQKNYEKAIETAKKSVGMTWAPQYIHHRTNAHFALWQAYDSLHNLELSHHHCRWYYWLRDSTTRQNFNNSVAALQDDFDRELKNREIELLKQEAILSEERAARKDAFNTFLAIGSTLVLLALMVLVYFLRIIRKSKREVTLQKKSLERSDAEKATLLKELHHRVKNNLQIVSSLLNLQSDSVTDPAALKAFREGQNRVDAMAMIHKHLYGTDELTAVDISAYLGQLVQSLAFSYGFDKNNFVLRSNISETPVDVDVAIPLGLIVNELVSNTFKHAFTDTEIAEITLDLTYNDQLTTLVLKDNGKGLPPGFSIDQSASFGLELVQTLVHQLKGEIRFENENGAMFAIEINHAKTKVA